MSKTKDESIRSSRVARYSRKKSATRQTFTAENAAADHLSRERNRRRRRARARSRRIHHEFPRTGPVYPVEGCNAEFRAGLSLRAYAHVRNASDKCARGETGVKAILLSRVTQCRTRDSQSALRTCYCLNIHRMHPRPTIRRLIQRR